jgi:hypothetical protein
MVDGVGDPNGPEFQQAIEVLYSLTFTIKFWPKKHAEPAGYFDYTVPPLEALWWVKGQTVRCSMNAPLGTVVLTGDDYAAGICNA